MFRSVGHELKLSADRIRRVKTVLEHVGLYVGLALYTAVGGMVRAIMINCLCSFSSLWRCSRWLKIRQRWKLGVFDMKLLVRDILERSYQHQIGIQVKGLQRIAIWLLMMIIDHHIRSGCWRKEPRWYVSRKCVFWWALWWYLRQYCWSL